MRLLARTAIAVLAIVVAAVLVLHTNPVQSRVLNWSIGELERRFDLDLVADDLHYNLAARRVTMTNVRLAAVGQHDNPFFSADRVTVQLPWAVFRGRLQFDEIGVERGSVTIARDENGISNLPPARGTRDPNAPPRRFDIRGLTIRQLDFAYLDAQRGIEIRTPQIRTDLEWVSGEGAKGPLAIEQDVLVRIRDRRVTMKPVTGIIVFNGADVSLENVRLDTSEGAFVVSGEIARAFDGPTLDLTFEGTTELAQSSRWAAPPVPVAGQASITARMTGAPSTFVLDALIRSSDATVGTQPGVAIDAEARLTPSQITVSRSSVRPRTGGEVQATVDVPFGPESAWWVKANYAGIDAATAFRLANVAPLPFGATLSGNAVIDRQPGAPFRLEVHNTSTARAYPGTAPLEGRVRFIIDGPRWHADQDHRMGATHVSGIIGGQWNRQAATRSTFEGALAVESGDVGEAARFAALFGLATPEIVRNAAGPLTADVEMEGTFTEPRFVGRLASSESKPIVFPTLGETVLSARFDASGRALNATDITARIGTTIVSGDVLADLETRRLEGTLNVESPNVADLLSALPEPLRLQGPLDAVATLGGTVEDPSVAVTVSGRALTLADQPVDAITADARLVGEGIDIEQLTLRQSEGAELRASGRYDWGDRSYKVELSGQNLLWRGTLARLGDAEARFGLKFAGAGSIDQPVGEGAIEFTVSGGLAGQLIDKGVANVRLNGDMALVTTHVPALGALLTAKVQPRAPFSYDAVLVMNRIDLAPLVTFAGLESQQVVGTASLSANATGELSNLIASRAFINLQDINANVAEVPVQLVSPSRLAWDGDALTIDNLDITVGQGRLLASGRLGEGGIDAAQWESTFSGQLGDLIKIGRPFGVPAPLNGSGTVSAEWRSTGGLDQSTAKVHVEGGSVGWADIPAVDNLALDATFDGTTLNLTQFTGKWQQGSIEGTASIPRAVLDARQTGGARLAPDQSGFAKLRVSGLTEGALAPWLSSATLAGISGRLSATLDARIARASLEGIAGTLVMDEADFTVAGVAVKQTRPSILELDEGVITAREVTFDAGGGPLTVKGTARLVPTDQQTLDLDISGVADLRVLSAFAPAIATDGDAKVAVGVGGTISDPVFNGRVDVVNAEVAIREPRIILSELTGTIAMDGQRVVFDAFTGTANGGQLQLDGGFLLKGFAPAAGGLVIVVDRAALEYPDGLQSEANAIVTLRPGEPAWSLTGEVSVQRSAYTVPISIAALFASRGSSAPSASNDEGWVEQLRLNLWVTTLQDLIVDNNYGRFEVGGALRVIGTVAEPVLAGRLTFAEGGEMYLAGNTFYIERGSISFTNPFRIVPEFDIQLRTLVSGTDVMLRIDGPLDRLRTDVSTNNPAIDSREALAMLFGGLGGDDAITLLSAELLGATGRAIGLDSLRVQRGFDTDEFRADPGLIATDIDPSTRLTLSKRLRPDVELILSQSLRESGGLTAVVSYKPRRNIELRGVSRDNLDRSVALRHEITFGGEGTPTAGVGSAAPEVSTVTISGNPGFPAADLVSLLDLEPGDRFDFHQWQRDVDQLRSVYHDRNQLEVRVRGSRLVSDDGTTVALNYEIEPGPVTEVVIEGHPHEQELVDDLYDAWRRTIFDRFLLEDIRTRVTRHLMGENVIGATVEAEVTTPAPDLKRAVVTVSGGTTVSSRTVEFSGNRAYDAERLRTVIEDAGLELSGWLDSQLIAQEIEAFYRNEGFLAASAKASTPTVSGDTGVLPVQIDEGARFLVSGISYPGVSPERLLEVAAAVRLNSGVPFVTDEIDAARRRVERLYADDGFNMVQIEVDTQADPENETVAVRFAVLEGLQQVVREVTLQGATRTDEDVVRRALRLRIGEPVDLGQWSQARKRLYDTNVFRQVDIEAVPMESTAEDSARGIQPVRAVIRVTEYPVWRLRYGAQFTDERVEVPDPDGDTRLQSFGVLADLQNQNLFGRAITAGIAGRYERNRQAASLFTSNSSFFGLPIRTSGFIFSSRQKFHPGQRFETIDERVGITGEQRWRPFRSAEVLWSYRFERSTPTIANLPPEDAPLPYSTSRLSAGMYFDRRDDPSDPSTGWFTSGNWEQGVRALGSDYGSGKFLLQHAMYQGVKRLVVAGRAQLGAGYGEELLVSERFQLGGATTVRGYADDALGPGAPFGLPGGDALLNFNAELRFPVRGWVQGVGFVDAGNVFASRADLSFTDLAVGYGIGLRLASPFAMLRVDFGVPMRTVEGRPGNRWSSGRWYFGVGHIF
jgi:outer membrane protein insertion porin family